MTDMWSEFALFRILDALEHEVIAATDDEVAGVLAELGMKPGTKGSTALVDLQFGFTFRQMTRDSEDGVETPAADETDGSPASPISPLADTPRSR